LYTVKLLDVPRGPKCCVQRYPRRSNSTLSSQWISLRHPSKPSLGHNHLPLDVIDPDGQCEQWLGVQIRDERHSQEERREKRKSGLARHSLAR
jgi:hypothetical protein